MKKLIRNLLKYWLKRIVFELIFWLLSPLTFVYLLIMSFIRLRPDRDIFTLFLIIRTSVKEKFF